MSIKDALVRQNEDDKILIGDVVKRAYNSKFGEVLRAYVDGIKTKELLYHQENGQISAERRLGRCEAYTNVLVDLERMIQEGDDLKKPIEEDEEEYELP